MKIICLTPVKNEDWILERFIRSASLWADHIIIADQNSVDGSVEIAKKFPKVILIQNDSLTFNEPDRQKLLINEARKISGRKLLVALDADEFLSSNFIESRSWNDIRKQKNGTSIYFECVNVHSSFEKYWSKGYHYYAYIDDLALHVGKEIDSPRLPKENNPRRLEIRDVKVLHLQYIDMERAKYKQIWYQCLEKTLNDQNTYLGTRKTNFYLFKRYNKIKFQINELQPLSSRWINNYLDRNIDIFLNPLNSWNPFLHYIKNLFDQYGVRHFNKLSIWDVDWNEKFRSTQYRDPRSIITKIIHKWLNNRKHLEFCPLETYILKILEFFGIF